jgi:hypothetical protein
MPHQDYLRRLIDDETKHSPASSAERGDSSPSDINRRHSHLGARALAALAQDESEASSKESDEPTGDTPRAMSAPLFTARDPPPPIGQGEMAETVQNLRNTKTFGISFGSSPADSVANRCSSAASGSSDRPLSNNIAIVQHAGRATMNGFASHNIGLNRHAFNIGLAVMTDMSKNPHIEGAPESESNDRQNTRGTTPTNRNGVVDLTMDSSDEDEAQSTTKPWKKQKTQSLSRSHDYEKKNYGEEHVLIQLKENEKRSNHPTLKNEDNVLATVDKLIDLIPNDFGARHPMPTSANNENIRQTVNLPIEQDCNKEKFNSSKSPCQTVGLKTSSAATILEAAVEGRNCAKSMHVLETGLNVEPAGASEKLATADKFASTLLCSLTGSLFCTTRGGNRYLVIRGFWEYEQVERKSFHALGSNRFELCRQISSDIETPPLTEGGVFNGSFAYSWAQEGDPGESFVIHESDVNISFSKHDEESQAFAVTGSGRNQLGNFHLVGTVWKRETGVSFSFQCRKEYSELFEPQSSPDDIRNNSTTWLLTNRDDNERISAVDRKKTRLSTTKQISELIGSGECRISGIIRPPPGIRAVVDRTALFVSKKGRAFGMKILNSEKGKTPKFAFLHNTSPFHAYYKERIRFYDEGGADEEEEENEEEEEEEKLRKQKERTEAERQNINETFMISTSLDDSNASHMSDDVDLSNDAAEENQEVDRLTSLPTLVGIAHIKKLQEKAGSVITLLSSSKKNITSNAPATQKSWQEIGNFESLHPMGTGDTVEKSQTNDVWEACYDIEGIIPNEDQVQRIQSNPQHEQIRLETVLGSHWASVLNSHCGLKTASELYNANGEELINRLIGVVGADFQGRQEKDVEVLTEGLLYGWYIQVKEALHVDEWISEKTPPTFQRKAEGDSIQSNPPGSCLAFLTPLSYVDLQFVKSQSIRSDVELSGIDPSLLAHRYAVYLSTTYKQISLKDAFEVATKWRQGARLALGMISSDNFDNIPETTRLGKDSKEIMHTVPSLSMTVPDKGNCGLPRRTIFTLDTINSKCQIPLHDDFAFPFSITSCFVIPDVLYEFVITVGDSTCSAAAGKGAFLTFQ